jgi:hypothetical protein
MAKHPDTKKGITYQLKKTKYKYKGTLNLKDLEAYLMDILKDRPEKLEKMDLIFISKN